MELNAERRVHGKAVQAALKAAPGSLQDPRSSDLFGRK